MLFKKGKNMAEREPKELSKEEVTQLSERLAYKAAVYRAKGRNAARVEGASGTLKFSGAELMAHAASKALLVSIGLISEDDLFNEIDSAVPNDDQTGEKPGTQIISSEAPIINVVRPRGPTHRGNERDPLGR